MDELLKKEQANQARAKNGNTNPFVDVINDVGDVERLRAMILRNTKLRENELARNKLKLVAPLRYKDGDKSVVPELIAALKGSDVKKRRQIYRTLARDYEDTTYFITEPALLAQLLQGINDPADESEAVQLAGYMELSGYEALLEKKLLSGKSVAPGRIIYWLGKNGTNKRVFDYAEAGIKNKTITGKNLDDVIAGLENFAKNGDDDIKKRIGALALYIYQHRLISDARFEDLKNNASTSDAAETILHFMFEYGDAAVIPIANDILQRNIRVVDPVKALIRLEGAKHSDKIFTYLRSGKNFYTGLDLVEAVDRKYLTDDVFKEVVIQLAKQPDAQDYVVTRIIKLFKEKNATYFLEHANEMVNVQFAARIAAAYKLSNITTDEIINDLLAWKLLVKKPSDKTITKIWKESDNSPAGFAWNILEEEKVAIYFDAETGYVPAGYDELLLQFGARSNRILKDMLVWMNADEKGQGTFNYRIIVVMGKKAYIATPEDIGDWYDVQVVNAIIESVLNDLHSGEKFVSIETGDQTARYIFGRPENVAAFLKKYK